jgi:hypothetical protein
MCDMGDNSLKYSNYFLPSHASIVKYNHLSQNSQTSYFNGLHNFGFHTYFFLKMRWAQITTNRILYFEFEVSYAEVNILGNCVKHG